MALFANYRADRLIAEIKSIGNPASPESQKALAKLAGLGPQAIDSIVAALTVADKKETLAYVEVLSALIDAKTLPTWVPVSWVSLCSYPLVEVDATSA